MPMQYVEPERFGVHNSVFVYRTYKEDAADAVLTYHYTTSYTEDDDFQFDIRDIKVPEGREDLKVRYFPFEEFGGFLKAKEAEQELFMKIIAYGLDTNQIEVDEDNNG